MRGKIVVGLILVLAAVGLVANLWFVNNRTPPDQRFNLKRQTIPQDMRPVLLLPERIGDFARTSVTPVQTNTSGDLEGSAAYADNDGKQLTLTVRKPGSGTPDLEKLTDRPFRVYTDAQFPFAYSDANGAAFIWINGGWVISTSTTDATSEALLQFTNAYPF